MTIVKNTFVATLLLLGTTSFVSSDDGFTEALNGTLLALTWSPDTKSGTIGNREFDGSGMIGFVFAHKNLLMNGIGGYFGGDFSYNKVNEQDSSTKITYNYKIINIGVTATPLDNLTLMAGVGHSTASAEYTYYGNHYTSEEDDKEVNFHGAIQYSIGKKIGIIVGYNTVPEAMNFGVSFNY